MTVNIWLNYARIDFLSPANEVVCVCQFVCSPGQGRPPLRAKPWGPSVHGPGSSLRRDLTVNGQPICAGTSLDRQGTPFRHVQSCSQLGPHCTGTPEHGETCSTAGTPSPPGRHVSTCSL